MTELKVSLFGIVHQPGCTESRGMLWPWEGVNKLQGDTHCGVCIPDGLPAYEPHKFTDEELDRFKYILQQGESDG